MSPADQQLIELLAVLRDLEATLRAAVERSERNAQGVQLQAVIDAIETEVA